MNEKTCMPRLRKKRGDAGGESECHTFCFGIDFEFNGFPGSTV